MIYTRNIQRGIILISVLILSSCKLGKEYAKPQMDMPQHFDTKSSESGVTSDIGWSKLYNDTILEGLIDQALINNKDILIATAKIKEMIAHKKIKFAGLFPQVGIEGMGDREFTNYGGHNRKYSPEVRGILTFKWELDIWGNLRWQNEAGIAAYMQSIEAQEALRLTIISQVAQMYFELKALDRELEIVKQTLIARKEGVHFAKLRFEGGLTSEIPYKQSLVELARTETLVPSLENEIKVKENDFSVLLGEFPSTIPRSARDSSSYTPPITLPIDVPSSVLEKRPDVLLAEQQLIEANANVAVALTDMLPKLNLIGKLGGKSDELGNFLQSPTWYIQSLLTGPVFNMGKNKAKYKAVEAIFEQQLHSYEKTILNVFREVNSAIITFEKTRDVKDTRTRLYESAQSYHKLARLQYINGIVNYIDVLDAQRQLFDAEIALNNAVLQESLATVSLYKSLGGGIVK